MRVRLVPNAMRRADVLACVALLSVPLGALRAQMRAEAPAPAQAAQLRAQGHVLTVVSGGSRHRIVLPDSLRVDMDTAEVLDSQHVLSTSYLLLTVRGPSKRNGFGAGQCGAGFETAIVWLELRNWQARRVQSQLVESCSSNRMITGTIEWQKNLLHLTYLDIDEGSKSHVLTYDRNQPERGVNVTPAAATR